MRNIEHLRLAHIARMAEPDDLRKLRQQAEDIRANRALAVRRLLEEHEKDVLRREIKAAGETPVA